MGIVVIGAVFVDIKGYPLSTYIPGGRNAGRIEQIGTPEDVYERPRTLFAADFIGQNNLLRGTVAYEFRATAVAELHDDASFQKLGDWLAGAERYFIQRFEPRETVLKAGLHAPAPEQLRHWAELVRPKIPNVALRGI